jgi:hypothetical protein
MIPLFVCSVVSIPITTKQLGFEYCTSLVFESSIYTVLPLDKSKSGILLLMVAIEFLNIKKNGPK